MKTPADGKDPAITATEKAIEILDRLISFDTTSRNSNLDMIDFVAAYLDGLEIESRFVKSPDGKKANIFASLGPGAQEGGSIALSGHTDVVPVDGQDWDTDPFVMTRRDGRLYGRGTADMKGFIACALAAIPGFKERNLHTPISLIFSYDEEVGCLGIRPLIKQFESSLPKPKMVIVGEPTSMTVVDAHKGASRFETIVTGLEAHSSLTHLGVNAIDVAARLIRELRDIEEEFAERHSSHRFTPPFSTINIGIIEGGTALNIVPKTCRFLWEVRPVPGLDASEVLARLKDFAETRCLPSMRAVSEDCDIRITEQNTIPSFQASATEAVSLAMNLAGQNSTSAVAFGTEAGLFEQSGTPTVICGPGDIAQAHKPNEFIGVSDLEDCMKFMSRLAERACA